MNPLNNNFLSFLSQKKTLLFLLMCLCVHIFNGVLFYQLGIYPLAVLNLFSSCFYTAVLLLFKKHTDAYIIFTYFEIVTFSFLSELVVGGDFFYIFFVIGMISVVVYLLPPTTRLKHLVQGVGIVYAVTIYILHLKRICLFPQYRPIVESCRNEVGFLNLCITLFTLFYISNLYFLELNTTSAKLAYSSNHDLLTGLFNRRFFEHIMQRNKSEHEHEYTIAIFDIDDFKKINDTYGHQAGDLVLKTVSKIIGDDPEKEYVPVRWGGEEFILFMPQTDGDRAYQHLCYLCRKVRETDIAFDGKKIGVTITAGMCTGRELGDYEAVIRAADDRLYTGKRQGKNCVVRD